MAKQRCDFFFKEIGYRLLFLLPRSLFVCILLISAPLLRMTWMAVPQKSQQVW